MLTIEAPDMTIQDWQAARTFCLATIKEVYGIDYRPDWHKDLDDMLTDDNVYLPKNGGWFILIKDSDGTVVACAGLRALSTRPNLYERFKNRWSHPEKVGALWRSYVAADHRGQGIGTMMKRRRMEKAEELGYEIVYLHASNINPEAITFGKKFGFIEFERDLDGTAHMDKTL